MNRFPLAGITVADFTWIGAGSYTTKILADFGADVIKIESGERLDTLRDAKPFQGGVRGVNRSGYFADRNSSKRSVTLNLKTEEGRALARRLIERSDVVANNFTPGTMEKFGLGHEAVCAFKPDVIYIGMSMHGQVGPESRYLGYGLTMGAVTGLHQLCGRPELDPAGTGTNFPDHVPNPAHAAFAILAALRHRRRTGQGQFIDVAQIEPTIALLGPAVMDYTANGHVAGRVGNQHIAGAPHGVYPSCGEDRWIAISAPGEAAWQALLQVLEDPALGQDARFAVMAGRWEHRAALDEALARSTVLHDALELAQRLQQRGVAAGPVQDAADVLQRDVQLQAREHWVYLDHPEMGRTVYNALPFKLSRTPGFPHRPAPLLGQHTDEVLKEKLYLADAEIDALRAQGGAAMKAAEQIAAYASSFKPGLLTPELIQGCGRALLDTYATAIAGRNEEASRLALQYARRSGLPAPGRAARDWGTGEVLPLELAALSNGVAGHVLDYDDVTSPLRGHPSVALLPALVGLAEAIDADGAEMACAYVAGFEVICKLSKAMAVRHYARGWHSTSSIGTVGAAVACARLLQLDARQTVHAIGLAVSQAAGTRANFGTHAKSFQAGHANAAGLRAALLASEGFDAAAGALDDAFGYMDLYANGESLAAVLETLGQAPLELVSSGIEVKKYPLCYATHRALDGVLDLRHEHGLTLADAAAVHVRTSAGALTPLIHQRPQTGLEAKFSMQYAVTAALLDGRVGLSSFTDEAVRRPQAQAFFGHVSNDDAATGATFPRWSEITLELRNGQQLQRRVDMLRGSAEAPLSLQELRAKVQDCLEWGKAHADVDRLFDGALSIATMPVRQWLDSAIPSPH